METTDLAGLASMILVQVLKGAQIKQKFEEVEGRGVRLFISIRGPADGASSAQVASSSIQSSSA